MHREKVSAALLCVVMEVAGYLINILVSLSLYTTASAEFCIMASNLEQIRLQMDTRILCVRGFLDLHEKTLMMTPGSDTTGINLEEIYEARDIRYSD